jgi:hypothetical protein
LPSNICLTVVMARFLRIEKYCVLLFNHSTPGEQPEQEESSHKQAGDLALPNDRMSGPFSTTCGFYRRR